MIEYVTNGSRPWLHNEICSEEGSSRYSWQRLRFDAMVFPITGSGGIPGYRGLIWASNYVKDYIRELDKWSKDLDIRKKPGEILCSNNYIKIYNI